MNFEWLGRKRQDGLVHVQCKFLSNAQELLNAAFFRSVRVTRSTLG
jgi:hypothetical protein